MAQRRTVFKFALGLAVNKLLGTVNPSLHPRRNVTRLRVGQQKPRHRKPKPPLMRRKSVKGSLKGRIRRTSLPRKLEKSTWSFPRDVFTEVLRFFPCTKGDKQGLRLPQSKYHCNCPRFSPKWPIMPIPASISCNLLKSWFHSGFQWQSPQNTYHVLEVFVPRCFTTDVVATTVITMHPFMFPRNFHHLRATLQCLASTWLCYLLTYLLTHFITSVHATRNLSEELQCPQKIQPKRSRHPQPILPNFLPFSGQCRLWVFQEAILCNSSNPPPIVLPHLNLEEP